MSLKLKSSAMPRQHVNFLRQAEKIKSSNDWNVALTESRPNQPNLTRTVPTAWLSAAGNMSHKMLSPVSAGFPHWVGFSLLVLQYVCLMKHTWVKQYPYPNRIIIGFIFLHIGYTWKSTNLKAEIQNSIYIYIWFQPASKNKVVLQTSDFFVELISKGIIGNDERHLDFYVERLTLLL